MSMQVGTKDVGMLFAKIEQAYREYYIAEYGVDYESQAIDSIDVNFSKWLSHKVVNKTMDMHVDEDIQGMSAAYLRPAVQRYRDAIRKHRDAGGHNRCWLNDGELYAVLPETDPAPKKTLPGLGDFLEKCVEYHKLHCPT